MKNDRLAFLDCEISCDGDFLQYKNAQVNPAESRAKKNTVLVSLS